LFAELEELKRETDRLEIDWGRLQIEQSTFATHPRVETLARERLALAPPRETQIVILARPEQ
jgi:cell division protein FtsL